jgi:gamma-glutamyltranspeptidase
LAASNTIRKGIDSKLSIKQQRAIAIAKATKTPAGAALARRIMQLEKGEATYLAVGYPIAQSISKERFTSKNGPVEMRTDDELLAALDEITRELKRRGYTEEEAEDDWSSAFEEA